MESGDYDISVAAANASDDIISIYSYATYHYEKPATLGKVTGIKLTGNIISWDPVENAQEYKVYPLDQEGRPGYSVSGSDYITYSCAFEIPYKWISKYPSVAICASSDYYCDSEVNFDISSIPNIDAKLSNVKFEDEILTWDAFDGAHDYILKICGMQDTVITGTSADVFSILKKAGKSDGDYIFAICARNSSGECISAYYGNANYKFRGSEFVNVSFDMNGHGSALSKQKVAYRDKVAKPANPSATGYSFDGWYKDKACTVPFDFARPVMSDMTLYAKWSCLHAKTKTSIVKATPTADGKKEKKCTVCGASIETTAIHAVKNIKLSSDSYAYNGKQKKPSVIVKDSAGKTVASKNYKVTYSSVGKNIGKYTVTVKFTGDSYSGSKKLTYKIVPAKVTLSSAKAGSKSVTVKWKQGKEVSGYEIQYSTSSNFAKGNKSVKITSAKTTSKVIKGLKGKTKYYVRIRAYKTVKGTKYYSDWSVKKNVTVKK